METEGWTDRSTEEDSEDGPSTGGRRGRKGPPTASVHSCDLWSVRQGAPQCVVPGSSRPGGLLGAVPGSGLSGGAVSGSAGLRLRSPLVLLLRFGGFWLL